MEPDEVWVAPTAQLVQIVRPCLHQKASMDFKFCSVVGAAEAITRGVGELDFDHRFIQPEAFSHHGASRGPESVPHYCISAEPHSA